MKNFPLLSPVALSSASMPARAPRTIAASLTVRAIGPGVSCVCEIGMTPVRLMRPTVGLIPTIPLIDDGLTMEPSVSVPTAAVQKLAETAAPDPELEPDVFRSNAYGFFVSPPLPLHPLVERFERMFAHSLRLVFPRITAPALRNR